MQIDPAKFLGAVSRAVKSGERDGKPVRSVILSRSYDTDVEDLWDAVTNPERIPRWFLPVEGDFRVGGRYQLKGNAGGEILTCDRPRLLALTWEFGPEMSWAEVELSPEGPESARFTLTHTAPVNEHWKTFGPGAVGVGWELGLMGMALHLELRRTDPDANIAGNFDENAFAGSPEGKQLIKGSANAWGEAAIAFGDDPDEARAAAAATGAFFTGEAPPSA